MRAGTATRFPSVRGAAGCALSALAALAMSGCYKPDIDDGGLACATAGKPCPDGFQCASNGRCYRDASSAPDGGTPPMCTLPPVTPTCQEDPEAGEACNPACQKGCECGRCNVVASGHSACVPSGTVKLGEVCKPGNGDNCGPGLICLTELCGNNLGRCYKHCTSHDQCDTRLCQIPIEDSKGDDSGFLACDVPQQTCDPINNSGCPNPAFNCWLLFPQATLCDCPGPPPGGKNGDPCVFYSDCQPGFVCINPGGGAGFQCRFVCSRTAGCPTGQTCEINGADTFGWCRG